ncbi:hypothetical protein [Streptomyces sp. NPDC006446]|uniref:hypothetical protein n=1 Tax=Streptomyces sp. NPDC006446 TaxID=3154301 RepID=UPI0033B0168C
MNDIQQALEAQSIAKFHHDSVSEIAAFVNEIGGSDGTANHIQLAAVEYAVAANLPQGFNAVEVQLEFANLAILHYNCKTQIRICKGAEHSASVGYFDMTVFSADASRLESIIGDFGNLRGNPALLGRATRQLVDNYVQSEMTSRVFDRGVHLKQALIWYLQLAVADYPGYQHESLELAVQLGRDEIQSSYYSE